DQATLAIAQIMLRNRTIKERAQNQEDKIGRDILYGKITNTDELQAIIPHAEKYDAYRILLVHKNEVAEQDNTTLTEIHLQQATLLKTTLKQQHFPSVISVGRKEIAIIVFFNQETANQDKEKLRHALQTIHHFQETAVFIGEDYFFGVSRACQDIKQATEC